MEQVIVDESTGIRIDRLHRTVERHGRKIGGLGRLEFDILALLATDPLRVWKRQEIVDAVWEHDRVSDNLIDRHVCSLRRKLSGPGEAPVIETIRSVGLRLVRGAA